MVSDAQRRSVQSDWDQKIRHDLQTIGNELFLGYFMVNQGDIAAFKKLASQADLPTSAAFREQTLAVMDYLGKMVGNMGSGDAALMKAKAGDHASFGVDNAAFGRMFSYLPKFMKSHGGDEGAWRAACQGWYKACP